jgi:5-methylcytosine-specific restriction endonuclease McrA
MGARQRDWARKLRRKIFRELGYECAKCGKTRFLELDCKKPAGNGHGKWPYDTRMRFYREMLKEGNLQVLCNKCHEKKSSLERRKKQKKGNDNEPF